MPKTKIPAEYISDNPSLSGTDSVKVPAGTTAQRGTGVAGKFRFNTTLNKFEGYTDSWGEIGGSGGSALETDNFTGDDSTTAFTLSSSVSDEDNLIVFIDGVYQNKADYVASGTTLTLDTAPLAGRKIVVYHVRANVSGSNCILNSFSGNGSTTAFTLTQNPASENNTQVFIDGVYQRKSSYAVSGTTLTFDAAPGNGTAIEVMMFTQTDINTLPASFVSGLTEVTAVGADHMMIFDATDSALKKALVSDVIEGTTGISSSADATAITINSSEQVGIGATSPDTLLELAGAVGTGTSLLKLRNSSSAAINNISQIDFELDNSFSGVNVDVQIGAIKENAGNEESSFYIKTTDGTGTPTERVRVDSSGNVGIGVSSLSAASAADKYLHIQGSSGAGINLTAGGAYGGAGIELDSNNNLKFFNGGTERAKIDSTGDFTATNVYAGGSAVQNGTQKKNFGNTTSYPNGSTDSFTLSASEAPIGSWVNLGIYISSGNSGGHQYCYLRQTNGYGSYLYGYVDSWYYTYAASNWWYVGAAGDRTFSIVHGTISATNTNDFRRILYFGYKMDN